MAEISSNRGTSKADGKVRATKHSTKIDMTPMVDLAFLLLTFFILTSSFNNRKIMEVLMPEKVKDPAVLPMENHENILHLVLAESNKIYWWIGFNPPAKTTDYSRDGVRKVLLERIAANPRLRILIKPTDNSRYENVVDILDEMEITNMKWYAVVDFTDEDRMMISGGTETR